MDAGRFFSIIQEICIYLLAVAVDEEVDGSKSECKYAVL